MRYPSPTLAPRPQSQKVTSCQKVLKNRPNVALAFSDIGALHVFYDFADEKQQQLIGVAASKLVLRRRRLDPWMEHRHYRKK